VSVKSDWISEALSNIKKCDHWAIKEMAKNTNLTPSEGESVSADDNDILFLGRIAEKINLKTGDTKSTMAKIRELRARKNEKT